MSYIANKLRREGEKLMLSSLLYDLIHCDSCLNASEHFENFLRVLDQMVEDDMIYEIKEVISDVLP